MAVCSKNFSRYNRSSRQKCGEQPRWPRGRWRRRRFARPGCFDLLHAGHVQYLEAAKSFGDILILGLNSDRSVKAIKGSGRPINNETDRAYIVAALEVVDYVVIFDEDTPYNLIQTIKPNTLVKGKDYEGKKVVGQDIVDELILVEFIEGKSSSQIINKIQKGN